MVRSPSSLRFEPRFGDCAGSLAFVDDVALTDLVAAYEAERGFDVVGGYACAPLDQGHASLEPAPGRVLTLLGCECGEVGCWPLEARVRRRGAHVVWDRFRQPHRPSRDYSGLGPFVFSAEAYARAVTGAR